MRTMRVIPAVLIVLAAVARGQEMDLSAEAMAIRGANLDWENAVQSKDVGRALEEMSVDAVLVPPGQAIVSGRDAIRSFYQTAFKDPHFAVKREPARIEVVDELAYSFGSYREQVTGSDGKVVTKTGKYALVWKRQPGKTWKVVLDIWNRD